MPLTPLTLSNVQTSAVPLLQSLLALKIMEGPLKQEIHRLTHDLITVLGVKDKMEGGTRSFQPNEALHQKTNDDTKDKGEAGGRGQSEAEAYRRDQNDNRDQNRETTEYHENKDKQESGTRSWRSSN